MDMTIHTISRFHDTVKATMTIDGKQYDATYRPNDLLRGEPYLLVHNVDTMRYMRSWSKLALVRSFINQTWLEMEIA